MRGNFEHLLQITQNNITEIDLSVYDFCEPAFLLGILSLYTDKKISIKNIDKITNTHVKNYLERCGFFEYIGHNIPLCKTDRNSLIEITAIDQDTIKKVTDMDIVTTKFLQHLSLQKSDFDDLYKTFYWIMRELIDNVLTHSQADFKNKGCLYMMQVFPYTNIINFCVVDNGIGIKESFKDSSYYNPKLGYKYYIDLALQKGVTRDRDIGAGNGLYGTLEIIKATGSELIFYSGDTYCQQKGLDTTYFSNNGFWQGNLLDIKFDISTLNKDVIDNLISKGALVKGLDIEELEHLDDLF
ncbi:MAG: hypothetical protein PHR61_01440 [Candidatus Absconditabacteria bacterium]|nr:hypothetical protein [Candidatus Absconditabacteria bacterium]